MKFISTKHPLVIRIRKFIPQLLVLLLSGLGNPGDAQEGWVDLSRDGSKSGSNSSLIVRRIKKDGITAYLDMKHPDDTYYIRYAYHCMKKQSKVAAIHKGASSSVVAAVDQWRDIKPNTTEDVRWHYACLDKRP